MRAPRRTRILHTQHDDEIDRTTIRPAKVDPGRAAEIAEAKRLKRDAKETARTEGSSSRRYPQWKIDLFRAGISERTQSTAGQTSGRAVRAPGS